MFITEQKDAQRVFDFFIEISKIPRVSENSEKIADYLEEFAKSRALCYKRDSANNITIRKAATPGYEGSPTVIFQSHTDIVADKLAGSDFNFDTDGINVYRDGNFLRAKDTTLGADDGIGMAYALTVLDSSELEHPEFEAVFTSDEEIGLVGASKLDTSFLRGKLMINIDSDEEGVFTVGCAGGERIDITLPYEKETTVDTAFNLKISGLIGGHSGVEIDKGRANAIKLLAALLSDCKDVAICDFNGGNADNAIPRCAECTLYTSDARRLSKKIRELEESVREAEPDFNVCIYPDTSHNRAAYSHRNSVKILELLKKMPTGVYKMSKDIPTLVETSSNIGIIDSSGGRVKISVSLRSSKDDEKNKLQNVIINLAKDYAADFTVRGEYPAWEYNKNSRLQDLMRRTYFDLYKKEPRIITIHAGLECGIFVGKIKGLDCVSIGPDNLGIHTPEEMLSIPSSIRVWEYIKALLKNMKP